MVSGNEDYDRTSVVHPEDDNKVMQRGVRLVNDLGGQLQVSQQTIDVAQELMRDAVRIDNGRMTANMSHRAAACLYYGAKIDGCDRGENEVADVLGVPRKDIRRASKRLREMLSSKQYARAMLRGVHPQALVPRVLQTVLASLPPDDYKGVLGMTPAARIRSRAETLVDIARRDPVLSDFKPLTVAAATVTQSVYEAIARYEGAATGARKRLKFRTALVARACGACLTTVDNAVELLKKKIVGVP